MNLRGEIINIIEDNLQGSEVGIDGQEEATDEILKLFEKRIDELGKTIPDPNKINVYNDDGYANNEKYGFFRQYLGQLELIKQIKEMLK
jgi:hypothetical protein